MMVASIVQILAKMKTFLVLEKKFQVTTPKDNDYS